MRAPAKAQATGKSALSAEQATWTDTEPAVSADNEAAFSDSAPALGVLLFSLGRGVRKFVL